MRTFFVRLLWILTPFLFNTAKSQPDHFAYAVTAIHKGSGEWVALRTLDTRTGAFGPVIMNVQEPAGVSVSPAVNSALNLVNPQNAPGNSVAAIAYDRRFNRLYYVPMKSDELHYIDLASNLSVTVSGQSFSQVGKYDSRNAGPVNRMVIAPDEFGYMITNDGTHLMRFTTSGAIVLKDLGDLTDDPSNKENSIHSICANSGGDLVADDAGHLYLITGYNHIYKVDIASRITTYLATIKGLPEKFTTSGAAVHENGKQIIISSAVYADASFIIDQDTWTASPLASEEEKFESADLANGNVLTTKTNVFVSKNPKNQNQIRVFPNPVLDDQISIQFNNLPPGRYTIQLANTTGTRLKQQAVLITALNQSEPMQIPHIPQGFYYIRILDEKNTVVGTEKLVVERW